MRCGRKRQISGMDAENQFSLENGNESSTSTIEMEFLVKQCVLVAYGKHEISPK